MGRTDRIRKLARIEMRAEQAIESPYRRLWIAQLLTELDRSMV
jgi:hypothetical protein